MLTLQYVFKSQYWEHRMAEQLKKPVTSITINYEDGTHEDLFHYALVGSGEEVWFSIMFSPLKTTDKIIMNNMLASLSEGLLESIDRREGKMKEVGDVA
jgi:hypothetical protein